MDTNQFFSVDAWSEEDERKAARHHVSLSVPEQVFCWTRAAGEYLYGDASGLRALVPDLAGTLRHQNLNQGYPEAYVRKADPDDAVPVDVILYGAVCGGLPLDRPSVVTFRNNLNKLLMTPLQPKDPWVIDAVWHGTTLFLEIVKLPERNQNPEHDRYTYYGYKFEALCTGSGSSDVVDSTSEFAVMLQLRLGRHLILMAAEIDAWETPVEDVVDPGVDYVGYAELKTFVLPTNKGAKERLFRDKYPRWWVQSFLAGVPTLVLGGRDRSGVLKEIDRVPVCRLPSLAREGGHPFDAFRLLRFGDAALEWMSATAAAQPHVQVRFAYDPAERAITATPLGPEEGTGLPGRVAAALSPLPAEGGVDAGQEGDVGGDGAGPGDGDVSEEEF